MEQQPIDDEAEVFIFERLVAIHAADGAGFGELTLVAEQVGHVVLAETALADAAVVQAEVGEGASRDVHEAFAEMGEAGVILAVHAVAESVVEQVAFVEGGFAPVKTGGRADVASILHENAEIKRRGGHAADEFAIAIDVVPTAVDHIRFGMLSREIEHRLQRTWLQAVVSIEPHHPVALGLAESLVDAIGHALVRLLEELGMRIAGDDFGRVVGRARIHYQMLEGYARRGGTCPPGFRSGG